MRAPPTRLPALLAVALALSAAAEERPAFHAVLTPDRNPVYRNEIFTFTLTVYATVGAGDLGREISIGDLPADTLLRMQEFRQLEPQPVERDGVRYEARRFVCRAEPVVEGTVRLRPTLRGSLHTFTRSYFMSQHFQQDIGIPVAPLDLVIRPLPAAGQPPDFSGAVGQFDLEVSADPTNVPHGGLVTLTMRVSGRGNLLHVIPPAAPRQDGLKAYDRRELSDRSNDTRRVFQQVLLPDESRVSRIDPVTFVYFDPRAEAYRRISRGPFPLTFHDAPPVVQPAPLVGETPPRPPVRLSLPLKQAPARWARAPGAESGTLADPAVSERFEAAGAALRGGHGDDAQARYEALWDSGIRSPELAHNLGAACLVSGQAAAAVLWFGRALAIRPRDPASRAGMADACAQAHVEPADTGFTRWLTRAEWRLFAAGAAALLLVLIARMAARPTSARRAAALASAILACAAGWGYATRIVTERQPAAVAVAGDSTIRLAPSADAPSVATLRAGQTVRIVEESDGWLRVRAGHATGWMRDGDLKRIDRPAGRQPDGAVDSLN